MAAKKVVKTRNRTVIEYAITFGVCAVLTFIWLAASGIFSTVEQVNETYHRLPELAFTTYEQKNFYLLVNAFFGVGVICAALGLLLIASNGGAFEMLVYGIKRFGSLFRKEPNKIKYKTYYDYHMARSAEPKYSFTFMVVVGGVYLAISMIMLVFYFQTNPPTGY